MISRTSWLETFYYWFSHYFYAAQLLIVAQQI